MCIKAPSAQCFEIYIEVCHYIFVFFFKICGVEFNIFIYVYPT